MKRGTEKPTAHGSRSLNAAEKNYAQIEKETLALVEAIKKFHKYLYGRHFTLRTDHKPLLPIFGSKKGVPVHPASRLMRSATMVIGYDFYIEYIKTDSFGQADGLSRLMQRHPLTQQDSVIAIVKERGMKNCTSSSLFFMSPIADYMTTTARSIKVVVSKDYT
ncbi:hypothetical protein ANCCEY_13970 [Ancylostoma ceylanicum]|nr:hypothetical protein ANCCEY_13970 [Ancylostoma ceylanicum]EYC35115.1 hypothetical protein Y032_1146g3686 [Ancylostoma ceylanicum]